MSTTKFTPGPWTVQGPNPEIIESLREGIFVATVYKHKCSLADAHLISAAPDLFDALIAMLFVMSPAELENMPFAAARARAALDKATGVAS